VSDERPLAERIGTAAIAFRGYNVTNLGRTPELLAHPAYGPVFRRHLKQTAEVYAQATGRSTDLVARGRERRKTTIRSYGPALALIVGAELAQLECLEQFHGIRFEDAALCFGYSLGEASALVATGVYPVESVLRPLLALAGDSVALAGNVRMGVVFSRGREIDVVAVERLCLEITAEGRGTIAISSYLAPNTLLLLGQGSTLTRFSRAMKTVLSEGTRLRRNPHRWPPLHTPIVRQKNIRDRAAVMFETLPGGFTAPSIRLLSVVTGSEAYGETNSRDILAGWVDNPQRLWDVVRLTLEAGVDTVINVGPEPNIIPATFNRLKANVAAQLAVGGLTGLGLRAVSQLVRRRTWLIHLISDDATLLRAPHVEQINLEDWLLEHEPGETGGSQ